MDYDFEVTQYFLFLLDLCKDPADIFPDNSPECCLAKEWLEKLCTYKCESLNERRLRNVYLSHLCACLNETKLRGPFANKPRPGHLEKNINFEETPSNCKSNENFEQRPRLTCDDRDMIEECLLKITPLDTDSSINANTTEKCKPSRKEERNKIGACPEPEKSTILPKVTAECAQFKETPLQARSTISNFEASCSKEKPSKRIDRGKYFSKPGPYEVKSKNNCREEKAPKENDYDQYTWKSNPSTLQCENMVKSSNADAVAKQNENEKGKLQADCVKNGKSSNSQARPEVNCSQDLTLKKNDWDQYSSKVAELFKKNRWDRLFSQADDCTTQNGNDIRQPQAENAKSKDCSNSCTCPLLPRDMLPNTKESEECSNSCACSMPPRAKVKCAEDMASKANECDKGYSKPDTSQRNRWEQHTSKPESCAEQNENEKRKPATECAKSKERSNPRDSRASSPWEPSTSKPESCGKQNENEKRNPLTACAVSRESTNVQACQVSSRWEKYFPKPESSVKPSENKTRESTKSRPCHVTRRDDASFPEKSLPKRSDSIQCSSKPESCAEQNENEKRKPPTECAKSKERSCAISSESTNSLACHVSSRWEKYFPKPESSVKPCENEKLKFPKEYDKTRESTNSRPCDVTRRDDASFPEKMLPKRSDSIQCSSKPDSNPEQHFKWNYLDQYLSKSESYSKQNANETRKPPIDYAKSRESSNCRSSPRTPRAEANCAEEMPPKSFDWCQNSFKPDKNFTSDYQKEKSSKRDCWDQYPSKPEPCAVQNENDIRPQNREKPEMSFVDKPPCWSEIVSKSKPSAENPECSCLEDIRIIQPRPHEVETNNRKIQPECITTLETDNTRYRMPRPFTELCEKYKMIENAYRPQATTCRQPLLQQLPIEPQMEDRGDTMSIRSGAQSENFSIRSQPRRISDASRPEMQNDSYESMFQPKENPIQAPFVVKTDIYNESPQSKPVPMGEFFKKPRSHRSRTKFTPRPGPQNENYNISPPPTQTMQPKAVPPYVAQQQMHARPSPLTAISSEVFPFVASKQNDRQEPSKITKPGYSMLPITTRGNSSRRQPSQRIRPQPPVQTNEVSSYTTPNGVRVDLESSQTTRNTFSKNASVNTASKTSKLSYKFQSLNGPSQSHAVPEDGRIPYLNYIEQPSTSKQQTTMQVLKPPAPRKMGRGNAFTRMGLECFCDLPHSSSELTSEEDEVIAVESYHCQDKQANQPPTNSLQSAECYTPPSEEDTCPAYTQPEEDICLPVQKDPEPDPYSESRCLPPVAPKSDASLCPRKAVSFCPSKSNAAQELLRDDIYDLLDSIACELRGDTEPGCSVYLESELKRYKEFITANTNEAACAMQEEQSSAKLRTFLLLRLQNDLVKLLTDECI